MSKRIDAAIEKFLAERRKSQGGWAEITDGDMDQLYHIIDLLVAAKCQKDPDGDYPIQVKLVNRRTHWPVHFDAVPYATGKDQFDAAIMNLSIAIDGLRNSTDEVSAHLRIEQQLWNENEALRARLRADADAPK